MFGNTDIPQPVLQTMANCSQVTDWAIHRLIKNNYQRFVKLCYFILTEKKIEKKTQFQKLIPYLRWCEKHFNLLFGQQSKSWCFTTVASFCLLFDEFMEEKYKSFAPN